MDSEPILNTKEPPTSEKVSTSAFPIPDSPASPDPETSTSYDAHGSSFKFGQIAGPSRARQSPRILVRVPPMSANGLKAKAFVAKVTAINRRSRSTSKKISANKASSEKQVSNGEPNGKIEESGKQRPKSVSETKKKKCKLIVRPPSRVARCRILFPDAKYTIVREALMPENVSAEMYYHLMSKSFINLKDILNKTINLKINSPSPCVPYREKKRRSSTGGKLH